ncbi:hypothetical protein AVEN_212591-1 [Araneus ventricosus]|uniref:Uncharacterized protein n=1 Tax=Araneus ventricosus TaxID=182803 RepID=A0A4Y2LQ62_ARAVE|nr:hypothetical protein AVEN_212591-1 [Araneus ventricosus]
MNLTPPTLLQRVREEEVMETLAPLMPEVRNSIPRQHSLEAQSQLDAADVNQIASSHAKLDLWRTDSNVLLCLPLRAPRTHFGTVGET